MNAHAKWPNKIGISLALLLLTGNLMLLCWYLFVGYQSNFHSDSAVNVLLARETVETGQYFPRDWNYVKADSIAVLHSFRPAGFPMIS